MPGAIDQWMEAREDGGKHASVARLGRLKLVPKEEWQPGEALTVFASLNDKRSLERRCGLSCSSSFGTLLIREQAKEDGER